MIVFYTDFGGGPYLGQMEAAVYRAGSGLTVVNLLSRAPRFRPKLAAYLLAAYPGEFPAGTVFVCVVDPGVGQPERGAVVLWADERWFVGPDNGLFDVLVARAGRVRCWDIDWRRFAPSASFHGRDVFAPIAAVLARGGSPPGKERAPTTRVGTVWPEDLPEVVFIDDYGNAMTGVRACVLDEGGRVMVGGRVLPRARTFSDMPPGQAFWYSNSVGLVELAVNQGRADELLGLSLGHPVTLQ
ncbi:MAG TPA: hypothetical protein ENJ19_11135 [Gammaproteobacteria bacterium]|nr:hypothetical protein [Gammaproteobacteria bacterium]